MKVLSMAAAAFAVFASARAFAAADVFPVAPAGRAPVLDGRIADGEYAEAVGFSGFLAAKSQLRLAPRGDGSVLALVNGDTLYLGFKVRARNVDVGGGLRASVVKRDGPLWCDDAIEVAVSADDPDRIAHFIVNSVGAIYDSLSARRSPADRKWNCKGVKSASTVIHGWWTLELAIPLESISPATKGTIWLQAATCGPGSSGAASLNASPAHIQGPKYGLKLERGAPAVQHTTLGEVERGLWKPVVAIASAPAGKKYEAELALRSVAADGSDGAIVASEKAALAAGEQLSFEYKTRSRGEFRLSATVKDGERTVYSRYLTAARGSRTEDIPASAEFDLDGVGETVIYHYPGMDKMRVKVFAADPGSVKSVEVSSSAGETVLERAADGLFTALAPSPSEPGSHPVSITVKTGAGEKRFDNIWTLVKRKFEWEGNRIGEEKIVIPPFSPIAVKGSVAGVTLRDYEFGAAGLLKRFTALGREMLADPMYFEVVADGKKSRFEGGAPEIKVRNGGHDAQIRSAASADGITLATEGLLEYDGFVWNKVKLSGVEGRRLERLTLVIPLKDAEAPLMHICTADSIRNNPTGRVPAGEGTVWDGTRLYREGGFVDKMYASQAVPYIWLGAERRGLSWFINNTAGMLIDAKRPAVRIIRRDSTLSLEVDFINVASSLAEGHAFAYGFEATPVKTPDRKMYRHFQTEVGPHPENWISRFEARQGLANFWNRWSRKPQGDDWTGYTKLLEHISAVTGESAAGFKAAFIADTNRWEGALKAYADRFPNVGRQTRYEWTVSCRDYALKNALALKDPAYPFRYSDPTLTWEEEEDLKAYRSEWISRPCGYVGATRNFLTPSYLDYIVYYYKKDVDCGLKGLYFDDMFPMVCRNPDTEMTLGADGAWHGNFGILEMRELVKRTATMQHLAGIEPRLQQIHMTNCLLVPSFAFATSMLSWEDHYGEKIFQHRFPLDYIRAESLGSQVGAEAVALDGIHHRGHDRKDWDKRYFAFLTRTQQAILLPAGVKIWLRPAIPGNGVHRGELFKILGVLGRFEIWADDCTFVPFYEDDGAFGGAGGKTLVGTYRRPGKVLAIVGNQTGEDLTVPLKVDLKKLGLNGKVSFVDGETGEAIEGGNFKLPAWDLKLVFAIGEK